MCCALDLMRTSAYASHSKPCIAQQSLREINALVAISFSFFDTEFVSGGNN